MWVSFQETWARRISDLTSPNMASWRKPTSVSKWELLTRWRLAPTSDSSPSRTLRLPRTYSRCSSSKFTLRSRIESKFLISERSRWTNGPKEEKLIQNSRNATKMHSRIFHHKGSSLSSRSTSRLPEKRSTTTTSKLRRTGTSVPTKEGPWEDNLILHSRTLATVKISEIWACACQTTNKLVFRIVTM